MRRKKKVFAHSSYIVSEKQDKGGYHKDNYPLIRLYNILQNANIFDFLEIGKRQILILQSRFITITLKM